MSVFFVRLHVFPNISKLKNPSTVEEQNLNHSYVWFMGSVSVLSVATSIVFPLLTYVLFKYMCYVLYLECIIRFVTALICGFLCLCVSFCTCAHFFYSLKSSLIVDKSKNINSTVDPLTSYSGMTVAQLCTYRDNLFSEFEYDLHFGMGYGIP